MASRYPIYFLDTSIVLLIVRGKELADYIERNYQLRSRPFRPLVSVVSLGEIYTLALRNNWGERKRAVLASLEQELIVVDINRSDVLSTYAEVSCAVPKGTSIGENDLWIAASAKVTGATILTTDKDFDCLYPDHVDRIYINPAEGRPK